MAIGNKIRLLIIDDSALVRKLLSEIFSQTDDIEVIGKAVDPFDAREKIKLLKPDVLTLDIEMPKMDGITFLANLMRLRPMPVVMISTLTEKGADITFKALELGAVDFVAKPKIDLETGLEEYSEQICTKVRAAAKAKFNTLNIASKIISNVKYKSKALTNRRQIIAIGSSTGGTEAVREILMGLPEESPPIVVTQHIPKLFSTAFAKRLDGMCDLNVVEGANGMPIRRGHVYIAPGDRHLTIKEVSGNYICRIDDSPAVNRHKPSVDVMFQSVQKVAGQNAIAIILTGMGHDGAREMLEMSKAGSMTIAQDEASSVVWGMPRAAVALSAVKMILPLNKISRYLISLYE